MMHVLWFRSPPQPAFVGESARVDEWTLPQKRNLRSMDEPAETPSDATPPRVAAGKPRSCLPTVVGMILGVVLSLYLARRFFGDPMPEMTAESLRQAEQRWTSAGIRDYDVEVEVKSRQTETYRVEVRDG